MDARLSKESMRRDIVSRRLNEAVADVRSGRDLRKSGDLLSVESGVFVDSRVSLMTMPGDDAFVATIT